MKLLWWWLLLRLNKEVHSTVLVFDNISFIHAMLEFPWILTFCCNYTSVEIPIHDNNFIANVIKRKVNKASIGFSKHQDTHTPSMFWAAFQWGEQGGLFGVELPDTWASFRDGQAVGASAMLVQTLWLPPFVQGDECRPCSRYLNL